MTAALIILAALGTLGSLFVIGSLILAGEADDDLADKLAYGDWPVVPEVFPPQHDEGTSR